MKANTPPYSQKCRKAGSGSGGENDADDDDDADAELKLKIHPSLLRLEYLVK